MKNFLLLSVLSLLLAACTRGYLPDYSQKELLVDFPLPSHDYEIPVYLPEDTLPSREYVRVGILEAWGVAYTSYNDLIRILQDKGRHYGVDAIQLIGKQNYGNPGEYYADAVLSGVGLKYLKNMDYLEQYVKTKDLYLLDENGLAADTTVARLWIDFEGQVQRVEGDPAYSELVEKHSLEYLLFEENRRWRYAVDEYGRVRMRVRSNAYQPVLRAWFTYQDGKMVPSAVRIRDYPTQAETLVQFEYDQRGKMTERRIDLPQGLVLKEVPAYDESGKQVGSEFFQVQSDRSPQPPRPFLKVVYTFYTAEDVQDMIVLK